MSVRLLRRRLTVLMLTAIGTVTMTSHAWAQTREIVTIRGQGQSLRVYGNRGGFMTHLSSRRYRPSFHMMLSLR